MRKIILIAAFVLIPSLVFTQDATFFYAEIVGTSNFTGTKVSSVVIDYGQAKKFAEDIRLRNADGSIKKFNSMVDAMNWMGAMGWEFVQAYVVTMGNQNVYHWLLKKDTSTMTSEELESLKDAFPQKRDFKKDTSIPDQAN